MYRGLMGGNTGLGGQQRGGGGGNSGGGGSTGGGGLTFKNRPSHHKYKSPKQFELQQS